MQKPPLIVLMAAAVALAALTLLVPVAPFFDPWAWLGWGREAIAFELDTTAGPSWKPLPVALAAAFAPLGDAAPDLWLLVARSGWLLAAGLAWRLASRLALTGEDGRWSLVAGAIAAAGVILINDPFTAWIRQGLGGLSEPLAAALVLGAVDRDLDRRYGQTLALGFGASLLRPEAWPLLGAYAIYRGSRQPRLRAPAAIAFALIPVLWLVPDLLGAGDPLTGAIRAREGTGSPPREAIEVLGRALELPLAALWPAAGLAVWRGLAGRRPEIAILALGAIAWIAIVAALAAAGYAGLPRFMAPAAAVVCVLGAIGAASLGRIVVDGAHPRSLRRPWPAVAIVVLAAAILGQAVPRAIDLPEQLADAVDAGRSVEGMFSVVEAAGPARLARCERAVVSEFLLETALAWKLERPIGDVGRAGEPPLRGTAAVLGPGSGAAKRRAIAGAARPLARHDGWRAYAIGCGDRPPSSVVAGPDTA